MDKSFAELFQKRPYTSKLTSPINPNLSVAEDVDAESGETKKSPETGGFTFLIVILNYTSASSFAMQYLIKSKFSGVFSRSPRSRSNVASNTIARITKLFLLASLTLTLFIFI